MEELDLLKKDWNRKHAFSQVTEPEIYKMLHKKSSSIVKWIFIISVIELAIGFLLGMLTSYTKYDAQNIEMIKKWGLYNYYVVASVIMYVVVFYFIYRFYIMYRRISVIENTKNLISSILKTRRVVKQYIAFQLATFALIFIVFGAYLLYNNYIDLQLKHGVAHPVISAKLMAINIAILVAAASVLTLALWGVYRLVYGLLLKKLRVNYVELKKIDL